MTFSLVPQEPGGIYQKMREAFRRLHPVDRRELQDAQADHAAADGRAKIARDIFERAASAEREAADHVARLKGDLEAVRRAATERAAKTISDALRAGSPLPAIWVAYRPPIMPPSPLPWLATTRSIQPLQRRRPPFRHRLNFSAHELRETP